MSGWNVVSNCPSCGAPIYVPGVWGGITPPPPTFTCVCKNYQLQKMYDLDTVKYTRNIPAYLNPNLENEKELLEKKIEILEREIEEIKIRLEELSTRNQNKFLKKQNKKLLKG